MGYIKVVYQTPASKSFKVDIDQVDPFDFDLKTEGRGEQPEDSFDFAVAPVDNANDVPVDLELVLLNDVSGNVADTKYGLGADGMTTEDASSISFEVHCVRVITQNDAVGDTRHDEFATYTNSTLDTAQSDWITFG